MSTIPRHAQAPSKPVAPLSSARDSSIDLVRAGCLVLVVLLHALMVGVSVGAAGPVFENAAEGKDWFVPVSWVAQMMPLFFIVGGFSSITAFRRARSRGVGGAAFIGGRVQRLVKPAVAAIGVVGVGLFVLLACGVPADVVAVAGFRISQPLWFLGVYLLCQAFVPLMVRSHERRPVASLVVLACGIVGVDIAASAGGIPFLGFLNLAFVWLLMQQLGFWLADGRLAALNGRARAGIISGAGAALFVLIGLGIYSPDMYVNLNPPTAALALFGIAQLGMLSIAQPRLRRFAEHRPVAAVVNAIGARSMTVYLWHMPVLIALAGVSLVVVPALGFALPLPGSELWWATRPVWFVLALAATGIVAWIMGRVEAGRSPQASGSLPRVLTAAVLGILSVVVLMIGGITVPAAAGSVLLMLASLHLARARRMPRAIAPARANPTRGGAERYLRVMPQVSLRP